MSFRKKSGGGYARVGEPLTVEEEYEATWKRARLDTNELARLRNQGLTVMKLVHHFGLSRSKIKMELRKLNRSPKVS